MNLLEYTYYLLRQVPRGKVTTYGALAEALGDKRASRFVGYAMKVNPYAPEVPCHRVVLSDGSVGKYSGEGGTARKIEMLRNEGIEIINGKVQDMHKVAFTDFSTEYPLRNLRRVQIELARNVVTEDRFEYIETVGAIDVAYKDDMGYAACVIFNLKEGRKVDVVFEKAKADFPYIPTYFVFRESPIIKRVIEKCKDYVELFIIDGNGILHPYKIGIASHVGVELSVATMGVAKKLLCGNVCGNTVMLHNEPVGEIIEYRKRKIYASPGHMISLKRCVEISKNFIDKGIYPWSESHAHATAYRNGLQNVTEDSRKGNI